VKTIKTPGGRFTSQLIKKNRKGVMCGDCGIALPGVSFSMHIYIVETMCLIISIIMFIMTEDQAHELCWFQELQEA
jgi:hypothetical protein